VDGKETVTIGYKVRRVKGAHPPRFVIVAIDSELPNAFMTTSDSLIESELRARLAKDFDRTEPEEIDSIIQEAWHTAPI
jgi:hypothetical protein